MSKPKGLEGEALKEFYQQRAKAGGEALKNKYKDTDYFKEFSKKGVERRKFNKELREKQEALIEEYKKKLVDN